MAMNQADLFEAPKPKKKLELHRHCFINGLRARQSWRHKFEHSHEGGDEPHEHPDTGPASYTIDKDDWFRATGLTGGGRKKFTVKPSGEQFPFVATDNEPFEVILMDRPREHVGEGPGIMLVENIAQTFKMDYTVTDLRTAK